MIGFMALIAVSFSLFGFIMGVWAKYWEQLQVIPMLVIMPMTFLVGAFYSIAMLTEQWRTVTLFNPVVYLFSGFRWTFSGEAAVSIGVCLGFTVLLLVVCAVRLAWLFRSGSPH